MAFAAIKPFRMEEWQKGRATRGWYEEARLVAPTGGAKIRGPHPPRPPVFVAEGRVPSSMELRQEGRVAETEGEEPTVELLSREEAEGELRYLTLGRARMHQEHSLSQIQELVEDAARQAERGALEAEELGATLRAIATFRRDLPQLKKQIGTIADTLLGRGLDLQATGTTDSLWAVAEMCKESPMLQGVLPVLVVRLAKTAPKLTPEETLSNLWSIGALRAQFKDLQINMAPLVAFLGNKLSKESLDEIPTQVLADGLWSMAVTRTLPNPVLQALVGRMKERLAECPASDFTAHNTYSMIYSIAMLQETCAHEEARALLPKLLEALELTAQHMTPEQMSGCLWALGWLDPGAEDSRGTLKAVRNEIAVGLAEMKMKELSEALWGFAALQFKDKELLYMGAERFLEIHSRVRAPILAKHIARIMWAFAKFDYRKHARLKKAFIARLAPEKHVIRFLMPDQLHALLWSLEILMPNAQFETKRNIESKVKAFIKMRYKHGLAHVVDRYGDERVHKVTTGRIEPYVEVDKKIPTELRNAAQLVAARDLGENGPDVPNVRRKLSGRPRWSVATWVDPEKRFVAFAAREKQKALEAARMKALQAAAEEDDAEEEEQSALQEQPQEAA